MQSAINEAENIITGTYGHGARALTITYRRLLHTWTVTVYMSTLRINELCDTYDNAHAAWSEARRIAKATHDGHDVARIVNEKPAHLAVAEAQELIDGINATMGEKQAELDAATDRAQTIAAEVNAREAQNGGWYAARKAAAARNRFTRTPVHTKPPTPVQLAVLNRHRDGVIVPGNGVRKASLVALEDKGFGRVEYGTGGARRHEVVRFHLNQQALAVVAQNTRAAA